MGRERQRRSVLSSSNQDEEDRIEEREREIRGVELGRSNKKRKIWGLI